MSYKDIEVLSRYKTNKNNIVKEFYIPALKQSVLYKRAVGFFSSTALIELSKGLSGLIRKGGKIKFIVSPLLNENDIAAIKKGYAEKEIIQKSMMREFHEPKDSSERERLNWLAHLVANGHLEFKVAFTPIGAEIGMYHEKIGVMYDEQANIIAFTGSLNETFNAFNNNFESIDVFNSTTPEDRNRALSLDRDFDSLWNGYEPNISIIDFPKVALDKLLAYKEKVINLDIEEKEFDNPESVIIPKGIPTIPRDVELFEYQNDAINTWAENNYRGIFDMATGTGKTFTGLGAIVRLYEDKKRLAVIIVCPYQHLVEQWVEDILKFNLLPAIGYSASSQRNWKSRLENDIFDFKLEVINVMCFVTTNATFSSDYVQKCLSKLGKDTLLLVDEAHNFGATGLRELLNQRYQYRLALSATLDRHGDEIGTRALYEFFGEKCIEYGLERAIKENKLTPYYYHPVVIHLKDKELQKYRELSRKISLQRRKNKYGEWEYTEQGKLLLLQRARLIAGAENKLHALKKLLLDYTNDSHMLVYCGATLFHEYTEDESERDEYGEKQIIAVSKMMGNQLHMRVTHFTSMESAKERELIKKQFAEARPYQAIVAIKCLDEGVNIPSIKTAFILASSSNPKEYIQRRGRVLRKYKGKDFAVIYDFITLPRPLEHVNNDSESLKMEKSLIIKEISRMVEFGSIALNSSESDKLIKQLSEVYGMDLLEESEEYYE